MKWSRVALFAVVLAVAVMGLMSLLAKTQSRPTDPLKYLAVLEGGRVKPYDSFARESLRLLYGRETYEKKPAVEVVTTWLLAPQVWDEKEFVEIRHSGLRKSLELSPERIHFSPNELFRNDRFSLVLQELRAKIATKEKLDPYYQAAQRLENQLGLYQIFKMGSGLHVMPKVDSDRWQSIVEMEASDQEKFSRVTSAFIQTLTKDAGDSSFLPRPTTGETVSLSSAVAEFSAEAQKRNPQTYGNPKDIEIEVYYNWLHPFRIGWLLYLTSALLVAMAWQSGRARLEELAWSSSIVAFLVHCYGFALRSYLTGRPPVSNMYETVVWVAFGVMLFSMMIEFSHKRKFVLLAGNVVAVFCLIIADMAPTILDKSLQPLEPVLRSTLWLTIHVMTITISYSAFFLAWGLGLVGLGMILRGDTPNSERVRVLVMSLSRGLPVGVVLLAAGTILGGVWAEYSWGRFWGWDPKETWAFIALLGYLALLHARLVGWAQNFGMLVGSIAAFSLVVMAWYGVNYVLGAGLHTYGFGAGGIQYVTGFLLLSFFYVGYVTYVWRARMKVSAKV